MQTIFSDLMYFEICQDLFGWAAFLVSAAGLVWMALRLKPFQPQTSRTFWIILALCLLIIPLAGSVAGFALPLESALPPPGIPYDVHTPLLLLLAFVPAFLAAGILGPGPGLLAGALTGAWVGFFQSHNPFTIIEYGALALCFSWMVNQRYRTWMYKALRQPFASAVVLAVFYPVLNLLSNVMLYSRPLVLRIDYALSHVWIESLAVAGSLLFAGFVAQVVSAVIPGFWMINKRLEPSPAELHIETRFAYRFGPLALLLILVLFWGDWIVAGQAAEGLLQERMESVGSMAEESLTPFLETGQTLIINIAQTEALSNAEPELIRSALAEQISRIPYFDQLSIIDVGNRITTGYPEVNPSVSGWPEEVINGLDLIFTSGIPFQVYPAPPQPGADAARLIFMVPVANAEGAIVYALAGECALDTNLYTSSILSNLDDIAAIGGSGMIIDDRGRILYHPRQDSLFNLYPGQLTQVEGSYEELSPQGTRTLVYSKPVESLPWTVIISIPAEQATQLAIEMAVPLFLILLAAILVLLFFSRYAMQNVTRPIQQLAEEARHISAGNFTREIRIDRLDEVGTLASAFDQMRKSLGISMGQIQQTLTVSQGVASSLNMSEAALPILKAAAAYGASSARIVLSRNALPEYHQGMPTRFGYGPRHEECRIFDEKIWEISQKQPRVILTDPGASGFGRGQSVQPPKALIAVALQYEMVNYGALWIAYDQPHTFTDEETRFITAIGGQAALAAANTSLYQRFQIGHQRLQTVIESTPDAVLVTDREDRLLLSNPAARELLNNGRAFDEELTLEEQIAYPELVSMLQSEQPGPLSIEIKTAEDQAYQAVAAETRTAEGYMGKVCILHNITHYKDLEEVKSEFVSTVSHNLLTPLSMMQGYTSMISAVGETNPQQEKFLTDLNQNIEDMNRVVRNLLDMRRVESGLKLEKEKFDFRDLLNSVLSRQKVFASQRRINIEVHSVQQARIKADKTLIESALINLVNNAIRYNRANGNIDIYYSLADRKLEFSIEDTGIGISEVDTDRVFEEFYQVVRNTNGAAGSGLGLTIARNAVERHGGRIWLESELGKGTTFYFSIPQ